MTEPSSHPTSGAPRPWLSLLLLIHGVCVAGALWGSYQPSPLIERFLAVISPYVSSTHLDPAPATFYSTHGLLDDTGHHIELLETIDGAQLWTRLAAPARGTPERLRHLRLARLAGFWVEMESDESLALVMRDVADWAQRQGREVAAIRLQRQQLQRREDVASSANLGRRDPTDSSYFETIYTADVLRQEGALALVKRAPDQENARVIP